MSDLTLGSAAILRHVYSPAVPKGRVVLDLKPRHLSGTLQAFKKAYQQEINNPAALLPSRQESTVPQLLQSSETETDGLPLLSPSLALKIIDSTLEEFANFIERTHGQRYSPAELLDELRREFTEEFRGAIDNFAFKARALGKESAYLWKDGRIDNDLAGELMKALPIDYNRLPEVFHGLHKELTASVIYGKLAGDWGYLRRTLEGDLEVVLSNRKNEP